ncbi:ABC transporter ATP-binding protein [Pseudooceanicola sediminis]|uniref:ABC transporter ATP-binding protein n=1 Tax=Pseudooceanicola sediminis TaxID=2211117 RepID=A0A399J350_9RHOB|nr:ABC transporter ATP-binding protein [Pseudooceanicola sediminis]KAA2315074.1 ABC transporter ATP-binding protein [Puniceibacterium sp. HSS470]RII38889.1 ABC transporter ATP-binding protein [Pseudooceanicola sediminis]|tara:strand:- start:17073 stop:18134 length:1062 start_codon:yes stop_codon:yes gene_type:complete
MTEIVMENLGKDFGDFTALAGMNLTIGDGEFVALLGPSGCGKSTTMNMIAGMLDPSHGEIRFDGRPMNGVPMARRGVGFVFQNYAIFTHMSVRENLAYGLRAQGVGRSEITRRVAEIAELLQLTPMLDRRAAGLSVNILQRLAIGRSAVVEPAIFLLDEPLSNVDAAFRAVMRSELKSLQRQFRQTMVYVTHDQLEAMTMADRIAVMDHGRLLQVGTPLEVYNHPADTFVARFIGAPGMNLLSGQVVSSDSGTQVDLGAAGRSGPVMAAQGGDVLFGFRPEEVQPDPAGPLAMQVSMVERIGARTILHLVTQGHEAKAVLDSETPTPGQGEVFRFSIPAASVRLFDAKTERAL